MPEYLKCAVHQPTTSSDDDEYWAVKREDGKWDVYAAGMGAGWPTKPFMTTDTFPAWFDKSLKPKK